MIAYALAFTAGLFVGTFCGVLVMALVIAGANPCPTPTHTEGDAL